MTIAHCSSKSGGSPTTIIQHWMRSAGPGSIVAYSERKGKGLTGKFAIGDSLDAGARLGMEKMSSGEALETMEGKGGDDTSGGKTVSEKELTAGAESAINDLPKSGELELLLTQDFR